MWMVGCAASRSEPFGRAADGVVSNPVGGRAFLLEIPKTRNREIFLPITELVCVITEMSRSVKRADLKSAPQF